MGARVKAFGLLIFTPDRVQTYTAENEIIMSGEGMTVRVSLDAFIECVDWPTLATHYAIWRAEQDKLRKEKWDESHSRATTSDSNHSNDGSGST